MDKKTKSISAILLLAVVAYSCGSGVRKQDWRDKQDNHDKKETYTLVSGSAAGSFTITGNIEYDPQREPDHYFSGELLRLLDTSLVRRDWRVTISDQTIATLQGDTIALSVYDFRAERTGQAELTNGVIRQLFDDAGIVEKFVGVYSVPITALYFSGGDDNLCVVCHAGLASTTDLRNDIFREYISGDNDKRILK